MGLLPGIFQQGHQERADNNLILNNYDTTMLNFITIKNVANYDSQGIQLDNLKKINFIYGANGTGKTTISNFLDDQSSNNFNHCQVTWKHGISLKCQVYNKSFRERNFGKGEIAGVFTLGQAAKQDTELIKQKEEQLAALKEEGEKKKETLQKQIRTKEEKEIELREFLWKSVYKKYEGTFKEAFRGSINKEKFQQTLISALKKGKRELPTHEELEKKYKTIFGKTQQKINSIPTIKYDRLVKMEEDDIWKKKIIGKKDVEIAKIIQLLNIDDWVNQGRNFIKESKICPFCQQETITESFREQIEHFFDETYTQLIDNIKSLSVEYIKYIDDINIILSQIETTEKSDENSKLNLDLFSTHLRSAVSQLSENKELLSIKLKEPSRVIELRSTHVDLDALSTLIDSANDEISKHNKIVSNYNRERDQLILDIWELIAKENKLEIEDRENKITGLQQGINNLEKELSEKRDSYSKVNNEIKELNRNITGVQSAVDEINNTLRYYSFTNFEIVPSNLLENHYQIRREDGSLAESTLSEGEITFITFLYFLQLAKGSKYKEKVSYERILVVDDPISSLDSNILFVVSTMLKQVIRDIKSGTGNVKQLILLTHNVYFHKEVSFIDGRTKEDKYTNYWILRKNNNTAFLQSFNMKNPIKSSYELLWQELKDKENSSCISLQNTMRRIIENYFKILGKYGDDDLIKKFSSKEEQEICRSLISWINDGSHSINDDLFIEYQSKTIDNYLSVFEKIFVLTDHKGHYDMMMGPAVSTCNWAV
ncbi:AAA family ATPase [Desulfobulbus sp. US4]|nr:AAA family ATPase [Desulfobulbus sp. US4]